MKLRLKEEIELRFKQDKSDFVKYYKGMRIALKANTPPSEYKFYYDRGFERLFEIVDNDDTVEDDTVEDDTITNTETIENNIEYDVDNLTLTELREQFPEISARSKADFIEKLNKNK